MMYCYNAMHGSCFANNNSSAFFMWHRSLQTQCVLKVCVNHKSIEEGSVLAEFTQVNGVYDCCRNSLDHHKT